MIRLDLGLITACLAAFTLAACAMFSPAKDPAVIVHEAYSGTEKACDAYRAAVALKLTKPDPRADLSCRVVKGVCTDPAPSPDASTD